jgi:Tol biopolymer transport system component
MNVIRALALAAAALVLPCCRDQIGEGDEPAQVTVRATLTLSHVEPEMACTEADVSESGRYVVWTSLSTTLTANDTNGLVDVFWKDRATGVIENLTNVLLTGNISPANCLEPVVSDNGRYVAFSSRGGWVSYTIPPSLNPFLYVYRYDRVLKIFERAYDDGGIQPDAALTQPSISADGRFIAFVTIASNLIPANGSGAQQIYVHDMQTGISRIVSRQQSPALPNVPCNAECRNPRISSDGTTVVFESDATDLAPATVASPKPQVYVGTAAGDYAVVVARNTAGTLTTNLSYLPSISRTGRYVVFQSNDGAIVTPPSGLSPIIVRRDLVAGTTDLVTDRPGLPLGAIPPTGGYPTSVSADGRWVAFLSRSDFLAGGLALNNMLNVFVRDMPGGFILASRHFDGTPTNLSCDPPRMSADGAWVVWSTQGSTLVDGDTNGVHDVYLRGPFR